MTTNPTWSRCHCGAIYPSAALPRPCPECDVETPAWFPWDPRAAWLPASDRHPYEIIDGLLSLLEWPEGSLPSRFQNEDGRLYYPVQDALHLLARQCPNAEFDVAGFCGLDGATYRWTFPPVPRPTPTLQALLTFVQMMARLQKDGEPEGFAMEEGEALESLHELIDWARRLLGQELPTPEGEAL